MRYFCTLVLAVILIGCSSTPDNTLNEAAVSDFNQGFAYFEGKKTPQDYGKAADYYTKAAEMGHAEAQLNLGLMYAKGQGVEQNFEKARMWFTKSAEQGNAKAAYNLGLVYLGNGDFNGAARWLTKAAEKNIAPAQFNLGLMYGRGDGAPQDDIRSFAWMNLAPKNDPKFIALRDEATTNMPPHIIEQGRALSLELQKNRL